MLLLTRLRFTGYRSYPGGVQLGALSNELPLRPLTLIIGRNGTGKTQVLRLLHQLLATWTDPECPTLVSQSRARVFAQSIQDNFYLRSPAHLLSAELGWTLDGEPGALRITLAGPSPSAPDSPITLLQWAITQGSVERVGESESPPWSEPPWREVRQALEDIWSASEALYGTRAPLQRSYPAPALRRRGALGARGEGMAAWLQASPEALKRTRAWVNEHVPPTRFDLDASRGELRLVERTGNAELNLADAAEGIHQVLPAATLLHTRALEPGPRLDTLEQPELHLHDAMHGALGDLLLDAAGLGEVTVGDRGQRLVVETHSEGILLRVRRRIAEGRVHPSYVSLAYIDRDDRGSRLRAIPLDEAGTPDWWPDGVFLERLREAKAIAVAVADRRGRDAL